jgi:hypothetical protein
MTLLKGRRIVPGVILCTAIGVMANAYASRSSFAWKGVTGSQDVGSLDRRISSLEQRLYSIEASINRLQQSAISPRRPPALQPSTRDQEIYLLREEIQKLQLRVNEIECGLVKLDERTTSPTVREARRSATASIADPCRLNPATPLRLSIRPLNLSIADANSRSLYHFPGRETPISVLTTHRISFERCAHQLRATIFEFV